MPQEPHHRAALTLLALGWLPLACTSGSTGDESRPAASTGAPSLTVAVTDPSGPTVALTSTPVTLTIDDALHDACSSAPPSTWLSVGTMHTVVMVAEPVTVQVFAEPGTVCPGGTIRLTVEFRNAGTEAVTINDPFLILSGGADKWRLAGFDDLTLRPGSDLSVDLTVIVPLVAPAQYGLYVYGFAPGGVLLVSAPHG